MTLTKAVMVDMLVEEMDLDCREARNFVNSIFEEIPITGRRVVTFRASRKIRAQINRQALRGK